MHYLELNKLTIRLILEVNFHDQIFGEQFDKVQGTFRSVKKNRESQGESE